MTAIIIIERPDSADARILVDELESQLAPLYPQTSRYGYSVEKLIQQGVAFFVTRHNEVSVGCAGVQFYGSEY